eukprot:ANDGO_01741.mRNA.1 hypothetical protein
MTDTTGECNADAFVNKTIADVKEFLRLKELHVDTRTGRGSRRVFANQDKALRLLRKSFECLQVLKSSGNDSGQQEACEDVENMTADSAITSKMSSMDYPFSVRDIVNEGNSLNNSQKHVQNVDERSAVSDFELSATLNRVLLRELFERNLPVLELPVLKTKFKRALQDIRNGERSSLSCWNSSSTSSYPADFSVDGVIDTNLAFLISGLQVVTQHYPGGSAVDILVSAISTPKTTIFREGCTEEH